jgi:hypothetical protein
MLRHRAVIVIFVTAAEMSALLPPGRHWDEGVIPT